MSGLVTFIVTREVYSQRPETRHLPHRAGALHGLGALHEHDRLHGQNHHGLGGQVDNAGQEEEVGANPR